MTPITKSIVSKPLQQKLTTIRKHLHKHPEVSGNEHITTAYIADQLQSLQPDHIIKNIGGTGIAAIYDSGNSGKKLLFRAELDALPIQESNDFEHRSKVDNVSHKCGHDGHATILLGLANLLAENPPKKGKVILLFQPAEETGSGAAAVLADPRFADLQPDLVFAFHNLPAYPLHEIVIRKNAFTAAVKSMEIKLTGKTAHAAEPEHGINPALAISEILQAANSLSHNDIERTDFSVITPVHIEMGEVAYGVSAGYGELRFTLRCWTQQALEQLSALLVQQVESIAKKHHLKPETTWLHEFYANENDPTAVEYIEQAALTNGFKLNERKLPFKWGEDFGLFTQRYAGAMFGIGAGENCPALHNPDYDFPDEIISTGLLMFYAIISNVLK